MNALPDPQSNDDHPQLPLSPELISTINGLGKHGLTSAQKREHDRIVAGIKARRQSGVVVTVVECDGSVRFYRVEQFIIGPTAK